MFIVGTRVEDMERGVLMGDGQLHKSGDNGSLGCRLLPAGQSLFLSRTMTGTKPRKIVTINGSKQ